MEAGPADDRLRVQAAEGSGQTVDASARYQQPKSGREVSQFHRFRIFGSREVSEASGFFVFSHIQMMGYFRLGKG